MNYYIQVFLSKSRYIWVISNIKIVFLLFILIGYYYLLIYLTIFINRNIYRLKVRILKNIISY